MNPLAQRLAGAVARNAPRVLCFACLAAQQGVAEHEARGVALVLVVRAGLRIARRRCAACERVADALLAQGVA
jgi:hypothetical protein